MAIKTAIAVTATLHDKMPMALRSRVATAALEDSSEVQVEQTVGTGTLLIKHGSGKVYEILIESICQAVLADEEGE